jgi:hypothetical protein
MSIIFIATLAQHIDNNTIYNEREKQYMYSLSRIFSYKLPVYGIVSETYNNSEFKPKTYFPYTQIIEIPSTKSIFGELTKSQKEFFSLKILLNNFNLDDNTWVIKISGRYLLINDNFINEVKSASSHINAIIKTCDSDTQMYTFLFALRFKYFKQFFVNFNLPSNVNIEKAMLIYIQSIFKQNEINLIDNLGVFCNIADTNNYEYF